MRKLLTLILLLCTVTLFAEMRGGAQYDPGAARSNLSNVDAAATPSMTSITLSDKVKAAWADILGDIYASGTAKVSTGTAAAPAYSFGSDPNTGMYSPAADNVGISVAGAEALRVNSAGEMLIATSTDAGSYKLQVNGDAYVNGSLSLSGGLSNPLRIGSVATQTYNFLGIYGLNAGQLFSIGKRSAAGDSNLTINYGSGPGNDNGINLTQNNEVLIATGTDAGDYKLQVNGSAYVNGSLLSKSHYVFANNATSTSIPSSGYVVASFTAEVIDSEGLFADSTFTAPSSGMYMVTVSIDLTDPGAVDRGIAVRFYVNGSSTDPAIGYCLREGTGTLIRRTFSAPIYLAAGNALTIRYFGIGTAVITTNSALNNWIRICKIGGGIN